LSKELADSFFTPCNEKIIRVNIIIIIKKGVPDVFKLFPVGFIVVLLVIKFK